MDAMMIDVRRAVADLRSLTGANAGSLGDLEPTVVELLVKLGFRNIVEPHEVQMSAAAIREKISEVDRAAEALLTALRTMQGPAVEALNVGITTTGKWTIGGLERQIECLLEACHAAKPISAKKTRGRNASAAVAELAAHAGAVYSEITGRELNLSRNREGFVRFLQKLFDALHVHADPFAAARKLLAASKERSN